VYYRVAIQGDLSAHWHWKSTPLSSLHTLLQFLRLYQALPQDRLRVFSSSSREEMNEQLVRENRGLGSTSVTAAQFLQQRMLHSPEAGWEAPGRGTRGNERAASIAIASEPSSNQSSWEVHALDERGNSSLEKRRVELECGAGGDHDIPYKFALPTSVPQVLAWMKLLAKVQAGALQP
jgi:hypothetical protein